MTLLIGNERNPVILVAQLHKEIVYERKDERILKKDVEETGWCRFFCQGIFSIILFIYCTDELPGAGSVLHIYHDCCVQSVAP